MLLQEVVRCSSVGWTATCCWRYSNKRFIHWIRVELKTSMSPLPHRISDLNSDPHLPIDLPLMQEFHFVLLIVLIVISLAIPLLPLAGYSSYQE